MKSVHSTWMTWVCLDFWRESAGRVRLIRRRMLASVVFGSGVIYLVVFLMASLSACGPQETLSQGKVNGGKNVAPRSRGIALQSTLALTTSDLKNQGRNFCTATLVASNIAITAAHCVMDKDNAITHEQLLVAHGAEVASAQTVPVEVIAAHAGYRPDGLMIDPDQPIHDLAILKLASGDLGRAKPVALATASTKLELGDKLRIAGYGVTRTRQVNDTGSLRQVHMRIDEIEASAHLLHLVGPQRSGYARESDFFGGERPVRIRAGACAGDSGGPAYRDDKVAGTRLVGVTSFGTELPILEGEREVDVCVGRNGYIDLRPYSGILRQVIAELRNDHVPLSSRLWFDRSGILRVSE